MSKLVHHILMRLQKEADKDQSVFLYRRAIVEFVDNFLLDLKHASKNLESLGFSSECYQSLQLCQVYLSTNTNIFIQLSGQGSDTTPSLTQVRSTDLTPEEKYSQAFCTWLMHRFLRLLSSAECSSFHPICLEVLMHILHTTKVRSVYVFRHIISQLVQACADMVHITAKLYECADCQTTEVQLNIFGVDLELVKQSLIDPLNTELPGYENIKEAVLEFDDPTQSEVLQSNLVKLIQVFLSEIHQCDLISIELLYNTVLSYIAEGQAELKLVSLQLLTKLLKEHGIAYNTCVKEHLISVVTALIKLFVTGCHDLNPEKINQLEENTANLIESLIATDKSNQDLHKNLANADLQQLFTCISSHLAFHGIYKLATARLRVSVMSLLCYVLDGLPNIVLISVGKVSLEQLTGFLLSLLGGPSTDLQFAAPLLSRLIILEAGSITSRDSQALVQQQTYTPKSSTMPHNQFLQVQQTPSRLKRKRRDAPSQVGSKKKRTHLFQSLLDKAYRMMDMDKDKATCLSAFAAWGLTSEVAVRCLLESNLFAKDRPFDAEIYLSQDIVQKLSSAFSAYLLDGVISALDCPARTIVIGNVVRSVSTLLACHDLITLPTEALQDIAWILSLPWLLNDTSWQDLRVSQAGAVFQLSQELADCIDWQTVHMCLKGLALAPKECAPCWRMHVFSQALSDQRPEVKEAAIELFPMLLFNLGPNFLHPIQQHLLPLLEDSSVREKNALAMIIGDLACVAAQTVHFDRCALKMTEPVLELTQLECYQCSKKDKEKLSKQIDPRLFSPFLTLLKSVNVDVRKAMVRNMKSVFCHIPVRPHNEATKNMLIACLCVLEDEDYHVRVLFSRVVGYLLSQRATSVDSEDIPTETDKMILERCKTICIKACASKDLQLHETVLITVGQLARCAEGNLLSSALLMLLENRLSFTPVIEPTAFDELEGIAAYKQLALKQLFRKFRPVLCKFLVEAMLEAQTAVGRGNAENITQTVAQTLGYVDVKTFLQEYEKHLLPSLVSRASPEASSLIRLFSNLLSMPNRRKLIINNIKDIFSFLVCNCQKLELEKALDYLQKETDITLGSLLRMDFQRVHNELLLRLAACENQVFSGLQMLSTNDEQYTGPVIQSREELAAYLEPRLLGVLAFFDAQLVNTNTAIADKKLALDSLIAIVLLMGSKHISSIRHKIFNTLRLGLQFKDRAVMEVSCRAWNCFVRSLELPLLGQMLFQIVATLLPLLLQMPRQVADIINYMVVENRSSLQKYFNEIYFLPELPELADTIAVLKHHTDSPSSQADLQTHLLYCIKGARHESLDVRTHALSRLRRLLREKRDSIYDLILGNESAEPVVSQLVSVLLLGCQESDSKMQCLYGQCLGELGALDPGRLQLMSNDPREQHAKFQATVEDDNFVFGLISELIKAFLAATEPRVQDCSSFALQELLQIYRIEAGEKGPIETQGNRLWKRFPEQLQEILSPLLNSKYKLKEDKGTVFPVPIYGSHKGSNLLEWVSNWTTYLVLKVKHETAFQVFQACSATKRHNLQVALYLLPHIVVQMLFDGTEKDHLEMYNEVMEVVKQAEKVDRRQSSTSDFRHMSAQTIFSVLDYLTKWRTYQIQKLTTAAHGDKSYANNPQFKAVHGFLSRIPQDRLAQASLNCKAYTRALLYFEQFISSTEQNIQDHLDFLQRLYDYLNEPDGVLGVAAVRQTQSTLVQEILVHESLGHQHDAQACYERALQVSPNELWPHQGFVRSLLAMGQLNMAMLHTSGILTDNPQWMSQLNLYRVEAAWKMCKWDCLDTMMKMEKTNNKSWPVCIGRILMAAKDRNETGFLQELQVARQEQMGPLSAASMEMGSYHRGYECILRLHMLSEVEEYFRVCHDFPVPSEDSSEPSGRCSMEGLLQQWSARLQMAQSSFRIQEPILTLRRTLLSLGHSNTSDALDITVGKWWLWSAKVARKAGYLQTSYGCLLQASAYNLPEFFVEKAKWLWAKDEKDSSLSCLEKGIAQHFTSPQAQQSSRADSEERKRVYAQALLLLGYYCEETSNLESNAIVKRYKDVIDVCPDWELGHFQLAQYYERVMTGIMTDKDKPEKQGDFATSMVRYFGNALMHGNQHIYQAMSRLLSLWLDYGATVSNTEHKEKTRKPQSQKLLSFKAHLTRLNKIVTQLIDQLAPYQFFSAFPQLVSRICHAQPEVAQILQELIARLLAFYPQQAMWMMMAVSKSSYAVRSKRCHDIFAAANLKNPGLTKLLHDGTKLTERLIELCEMDSRNSSTMSMSQHFKTLKRMADDNKFCEILLPLQSAMTVTLPAVVGNQNEHNPFPGNHICIKGFEDTIEILQSLQRPKKITMIGSDGNLYVMMCKPKDDLRKDCRLMEFNVIVNRFLHKDAESRRRQLHLRTYTVTPLNEECGLLEWVNNTQGMRYILTKLYKERGPMMSGTELKNIMPPRMADVESKLKIFKQTLLPRHPAVFKEWFIRTFPDPTSWYNARVAYARTSAVISMIGYVLGLGDRHGENILFDSTNGDTVHVDFNCLFNRGETFEYPERVPFRLTHNMVSALGPMGVEGIFRRACEVTLRVVRAQTDSLMSILKPFIYDPLVEWSKPSKEKRSNPTETGEITNELALNHVQNIEDRLRGILKTKTKPRGLPLSIEGHVNYLIQEATDEYNLCQMYIGWAAYM